MSRCFSVSVFTLILLMSSANQSVARADEADARLREQALATMRKAADYYQNKVALHGGYVYYYSPDLKLRHGEGPATATAPSTTASSQGTCRTA